MNIDYFALDGCCTCLAWRRNAHKVRKLERLDVACNVVLQIVYVQKLTFKL